MAADPHPHTSPLAQTPCPCHPPLAHTARLSPPTHIPADTDPRLCHPPLVHTPPCTPRACTHPGPHTSLLAQTPSRATPTRTQTPAPTRPHSHRPPPVHTLARTHPRSHRPPPAHTPARTHPCWHHTPRPVHTPPHPPNKVVTSVSSCLRGLIVDSSALWAALKQPCLGLDI